MPVAVSGSQRQLLKQFRLWVAVFFTGPVGYIVKSFASQRPLWERACGPRFDSWGWLTISEI